MLVFATLGGWMADRYPKRSVIVCTQISSMILSLAMAALVWTKIVQPWQIIALAVLGGITMAFDMPARQSFVIEMSSREDLMNAISLNSSARSEEHTSELQSRSDLVCRLLLEK